jgi:hypothetical protein
VFENRVLGRIFGQKRDEVAEGCRQLHNEELHKLYSSPSIMRMAKSRSMRWAGHVARMGAKRNAYRILVGEIEGKKLLAKPRRRGEKNVKKDFRDIGSGGIDWIDLAHDKD